MRLSSIYREDLGFCVKNEVSCEGKYLYVKMVKVNFFIWLYCIIDDEL